MSELKAILLEAAGAFGSSPRRSRTKAHKSDVKKQAPHTRLEKAWDNLRNACPGVFSVQMSGENQLSVLVADDFSGDVKAKIEKALEPDYTVLFETAPARTPAP
jgi:hypothetical protein